ncbi:MAG TPA: hypothetical protein VFR21_04900 [Bradyrhizobium sp.]|jgi:hypothetical protein|nr:hypothetical protein [Bradyrhizobium sp.]
MGIVVCSRLISIAQPCQYEALAKEAVRSPARSLRVRTRMQCRQSNSEAKC